MAKDGSSTSRENQSIIDDDSSLSGSDININRSPDLLQTSAPKKYVFKSLETPGDIIQ